MEGGEHKDDHESERGRSKSEHVSKTKVRSDRASVIANNSFETSGLDMTAFGLNQKDLEGIIGGRCNIALL